MNEKGSNLKAEKFKSWIKEKDNILLVALMIFTVIIRLYYFSMTANQPTWWDEGDYLAVAKEIALPSAEDPEWWTHFASIRPPLMPLIWSVFIKLGISEAAMRFTTEIIPSIILVLFMYLLATSLFNKRVGLIAGLFTSVYWVIQFYGYRFMTDIPAMMFAVMAAYFFWDRYCIKGKNYGFYLAILFGVMGFLTRFPTALVTFGMLGYLLIIKKVKFFTSKETWVAGCVGVLALIPYFIYNKLTLNSWFPAASFYGSENITTYNSPAWNLFPYIPEFIGIIATSLFVLGLIYSLFNLIVRYDLILKERQHNKDLFLVIWLILQIIYFVFIIKTGNDRWILLWMPPIFIYAGVALDKLASFIDKNMKNVGMVFFFLFILFISYNNLIHSDGLIKNKLESYKDVQDTGLWLRYNTPEDAKIMGASVVQNTYYSQRRSYDFYLGNELHERLENEIIDPQGRIISVTYKAIRNETELECKINRIKPDYLVLHVWEPEFTPDFMYSYPERNQDILVPVKVFERGGQVLAAIYQFTGYPKIDPKEVNCTWVYERPEALSGLPLSVKDPGRLIIPS